jgi:hypothetical protein
MVEQENVYRLLPYAEMNDNYVDAVPVEADKEYIFFSQDQMHDYFPDFPSYRIDELLMTTNVDREYLQLYIVFSTEPFSKPLLKEGIVTENVILPKSLTKNQFEKWFDTNRIHNSTFNYELMNLEIVKR